jgi:hypothetical protein
MIRYSLLAVRLFDHAIDAERAQDGCGALVIHNDNTIAARRNESVIDCRN